MEAEIGHVGSNGSAEDDISRTVYTDPADAVRFAGESGCDALAVAIGTAHGVYTQTPVLNLDCLARIAAACPTPWCSTAAAACRTRISAPAWLTASPR